MATRAATLNLRKGSLLLSHLATPGGSRPSDIIALKSLTASVLSVDYSKHPNTSGMR
jgi:hypothetical protein